MPNDASDMQIPLFSAAGVAVLYALTRAVWHEGTSELGIELALLIAAVCWGAGAVVRAVERNVPKPISRDNGGTRKE